MDVGPVLLIVAALLALPAILVSGGVLAAILGWSAKETVEAQHEGSELIDLNR